MKPEEKDIRFIIADVDGTLVTDQRVLTQRTKEVIDRLHEHGVLFGIASGRDYIQLLDDNRFWNFTYPFDVTIGMNGGQIYLASEKQMHAYHLLSTDTIREIITMMEPLDLNPFMYGPDHTMICKRIDWETQASGERNDMTLHVVKDLSEFWDHPVPKIMFRTTLEQMPEVKAWADAHPSADYQAFKTQTTMLEFQDPRVNKGTGLRACSEMISVPLKNIMAFGDMSNDNPLLSEAGWGVCLKNGGEDTKQIADDITDYTNNEDGFARYLEDHFPGLL